MSVAQFPDRKSLLLRARRCRSLSVDLRDPEQRAEMLAVAAWYQQLAASSDLDLLDADRANRQRLN